MHEIKLIFNENISNKKKTRRPSLGTIMYPVFKLIHFLCMCFQILVQILDFKKFLISNIVIIKYI